MLAGPNHSYCGCAFSLNAIVLGRSVSDIVSTTIHHHTHLTLVTTFCSHFLCAIHNGETIDLAGMIYRTIIYHYTTPHLSSIHYPSLINKWGSICSLMLLVLQEVKELFMIVSLLLTMLLSLVALFPHMLPLRASLSFLLLLILFFILILLLRLLLLRFSSFFRIFPPSL